MPQVTSVPDSFILEYVPGAPGEYIKVYLYLMMLSHRNDMEASLDMIADKLSLSNDELTAALRYWDKKSLLDIYYQDGKICSLKLRLSAGTLAKESYRLNRARVKTLVKENSDAKTLLFVSEQYLGRALSSVETGTLLYFMDTLNFPLDLCEYLVEYCVSRGKDKIGYIKKVGLSWHKQGIKTAAEAKADTDFSNYYAILKEFGIHDRDPAPAEIENMNKWIKDFGFDIEIVKYACRKAVLRNKSFEYADGIITNWHKKDLKTLDSVKADELEYEKKNAQQLRDKKTAKNDFHNFEQRNIDFDDLEKQLDNQFLNSDDFT